MEKLELKYLAPYLPYGLTMKVNDGYGKLIGIGQHTLDVSDPDSIDSGMFVSYDECKPMLLPLSECVEYLNRENGIELDSSMLVYNDSCKSINIYPDGSEWTHSRDVYINIYEWLFQNHYDVFGLIERGLALNKLTT